VVEGGGSILKSEEMKEIVQCKKCERWQVTKASKSTDSWINHPLESSGLLHFCLKTVPELQKPEITVIDSSFVWTEPHSKRLIVSVELERGVLNNKVRLREKVSIDFKIVHKQCLDCIHDASDHTWGALIQLRQKRSELSLSGVEQGLSASPLLPLLLSVDTVKEGLDLYFRSKTEADHVLEWLSSSSQETQCWGTTCCTRRRG
jgi:nonsense-mediated mRNA decay protein 3